jgi:hypothetical protein
MSEGSVWDGNWVARLYERVRERGYTSLTAFAETRPTASLVELGQGRAARRTAAARLAPARPRRRTAAHASARRGCLT